MPAVRACIAVLACISILPARAAEHPSQAPARASDPAALALLHDMQSALGGAKANAVSGVRFSTRRVNFHSGVKRGEVTTQDIRVNAGLWKEDLAAKPADFAPDIPPR